MSGAPLPSSFDNDRDFYEENRWQKFSRRLREEPLIPLGCALTCYALLGATRSIRAGNHAQTNRMFRARIYAQGFTLLAVVAGSMYYKTDREKRKEFNGLVAENKAKEKNEAWIRELEARDREDKEWKLRKNAARAAAASGQGVGAARKALEESERKGEGGILDAVSDLLQGRH
ncbi:MAG: Respiratory supercomplex factor 1, mitochondrial [Candelaria pacifica]|nr:MAG: Respiratory supercomplex factor 1, mitochondrial [Candelaria pacifica]